VENAGRSQWPRAELREENENETRQENANQFERSSSTSKSDVADTNERKNNTRNEFKPREEEQFKFIPNSSSERGVVADTLVEGLEGHGKHQQLEGQGQEIKSSTGSNESGSENVADSERIGQQGQGQSFGSSGSEKNKTWETSWSYDGSQGEEGFWEFEPNVGRVAHGVPKRVDRLKSLGNSLVPQIPYYIGCSILGSIDVANTTSEVSQLSKKTRDDGEDR